MPQTISFYEIFEARAYGKDKGVKVKIFCYTGKHKGKLKPQEEVEELSFFTHDEYINNKETAPAVSLIFRHLKEKGHID